MKEEDDSLLTFEIWGTIAPQDRNSEGRPSVCLWGSRETARGGCDPDERVCRVRVAVLEIDGRNQFISGLRGDPGVPRAVNAPTRDQSSSSLAHPEQGWQPISSAPEYDFVLVYDGRMRWAEGGSPVFKARLRDGVWSEGGGQPCWLKPTHWMPLPPSPTESEKKK